MSSPVAKPEMRRLLHTSIKRNLIVALSLCAVTVVATKYLLCDVRKQKYADFYKNYDAEADFQRMRNKGLFQSAPADQ